MIELCIDVRMAFSSGIGTYIRETVPFFLNSPFKVTLLVHQPNHPWCKGFEQIVFDTPIYSVSEQVQYPLKIPRCDLFWSPHYNVPLLPIRAKKRVATFHDVCHLVFGSKTEKMYAKWVMRRALRRSDQLITVSEFSKSEIEKFIGNGKLEVISIGVNSKRFIRKSYSNEVRKKYQLPERFVLFVGNQKPHKNLKGLSRAFNKLKIPNLKLVLVGKGTQRGIVDDEDLATLYSMAEAFVFPSFYEGFGLPPLEAMSCGCPTAVSKAASMPEVCGNASLYFDPSNDDEIAEAISKIVGHSETREVLIERGFERIKHFDWQKCAERHISLFEKVCHA
jgi:glycosyltransferase involved in cell wall biosynthesis